MPKRKRDDAQDTAGPVFKLAELEKDNVGPILVNFPSLVAPKNTAFQCYVPKKPEGPPTDGLLVVGETNAVEFVTNPDETQRVANSGCRYLLALHDPSTSTITVLEPAVAPHVLARTVKKLKSIPPAAAPSALEWKEARTALGDTFGTKKAKAALRAAERRHVDVSAMQGVMDFVMDTIDEGAQGLPTKEEAKDELDANRLVPPFNATTADPAEVYPLHNILPEAEWKNISVSAFDEATSEKERIDLLPYKRSKWILKHLRSIAKDDEASPKTKRNKLKQLYYIAVMIAFHRVAEGKREKLERDKLQAALPGVSAMIVDGLLARFTEVERNSTTHHATSTTQTKLLTYLLALCLRVDNFVCDTEILAADLSMKQTNVNQLFASLGCKLKKITSERERARLGLSDAYANTQMAVLSAPVEFPKTRQRRVRRN